MVEAMKIKERENRRTIADLLALNNSIEQHVHFCPGQLPDKFQSFARTADGANISQRDKDTFKNKALQKQLNPGIDHTVRPPNIIRTIYMQSEDNQHLREEVEDLTRAIADEKTDFEKQINDLRMERSQLEEYARQDFLADQE